MRIAVLSNLYPTNKMPSGGVFVRHRMEALRRIGVESVGLALHPHPPRPVKALRGESRVLIGCGFDPVEIPVSTLEMLKVARSTAFPWRSVTSASAEVLERLDRHAYDVLVAHGMFGVPAAAVAREVSRAHGKPWVSVLHGSDVNFIMPRMRRELSEVLNAADGVVFVSSALEKKAKSLGFMGAQSMVIPNGVDLDLFRASSERDSAAQRILRLVFVGNLLPVKGADRIPSILKELSDLGLDWHLSVMGDGPLGADLRKSLLGEPVTWHGRGSPEDVAGILRKSDLLILPSRSEGWPCVIMEAFASGCRVAAADAGGASEAVGSHGTVIPAGDGFARRFAEGIARELSVSRTASELRAVAESYSWTKLARRELDLWELIV